MGMTDVEKAEAKYRMLRTELERENNAFELLQKQHQRRASELADEITRAWAKYHSARLASKQETTHE